MAQDAAAGLTPQQAVDQLRAFDEAFQSSAELRNVLLSPAVPMARKRALLTRLSREMRFSLPVRNFLCVVADHYRMGLLGEIRAALEQIVDERSGVVRAGVTSARELDGSQRASLEAQLARLAGKRVRAEYSVDDALIGGVIARIGSTVYDGSVRGQLDSLRQRLSR
jgi:F-type H+-transporting ATPase subunit delta